MDSFDEIKCEDSSEYENYQHMLEYQEYTEFMDKVASQVATLGLDQIYDFAERLVQLNPSKAELVLDCIEKCFNDQIHRASF